MQVGGIKEYLSVSTYPKVAAQFVESFCFEPGADASLDLVFRPQVGFRARPGTSTWWSSRCGTGRGP